MLIMKRAVAGAEAGRGKADHNRSALPGSDAPAVPLPGHRRGAALQPNRSLARLCPSHRFSSNISLLTTCGIIALAFMAAVASPTIVRASEDKKAKAGKAYSTESLTGEVVWLAEALQEQFGIKTDEDARQTIVALKSSDGELYPILKDSRGRAFHSDERLRDVDLELLVRRYPGLPMVQVVRVYALKPDGKYELDYWCDVCSIAMYELKPCECCQGPTRLRERLVKKRPADSR